MKVRTDFVTNSSSSSFILAFKDKDAMNQFREDCEFLDYEQFFNLIEGLSSDYLVFDSHTDKSIPIRPLIDQVKHINWGVNAEMEMRKLYDEDYQLKPWEWISIQINGFGEKEVDLDSLNFEDIDGENYSIEINNHKDNRSKENAIEELRWQYAAQFINDLLKSKFNRDNYESYDDYYKARDEYRKTEEYKELVDAHIEDEEFFKKKEKVETSELIVSGTIWDTSGGIMEYAIRNGFIEHEMRRYYVNVLNVG